MIESTSKRLFALVLEKLNDNTQGVKFDGNFMFQFARSGSGTYDFEIITLPEGKLEFEGQEVVPVVDIQKVETPYVQKNNQSDWEYEFYIAIKIERQTDPVTREVKLEFNDSDIRYQALIESIETLKSNLTFIVEGEEGEKDRKYTFKVREPNKVETFKWNKNWYQILSLTMNLTSVDTGYFGNETNVYFGLASDTSFGETDDYLLDFMRFDEIVAKTQDDKEDINSDEKLYNVLKRMWEANLSVNFNGNVADILLYKELSAQSEMDILYQIKITNKNLNTAANENLDYTYNVKITKLNSTKENNIIDRINFTLVRA